MDEIAVEQKYADYIETLIVGIAPLLPDDVNKLQQDYLENNIRHSAMLLASSMQTDAVFSSLNFEQQCFCHCKIRPDHSVLLADQPYCNSYAGKGRTFDE